MKNIKNIENSYNGYYKLIEKLRDIKDHEFIEQYVGFYFHFKKNPNWGKKVIDFGGRIGEKTRLINNVTVVEIDDQARKYMKKNKIKCVKRIDSIADNSIDTIYASHVLEHVDNPAIYLNKFYKKLKKGGTLILVLPVEVPMFETKKIDLNGHIYNWNFVNINTLLEKLNFKVEESYMYSFTEFTFFLKTFGNSFSHISILYSHLGWKGQPFGFEKKETFTSSFNFLTLNSLASIKSLL